MNWSTTNFLLYKQSKSAVRRPGEQGSVIVSALIFAAIMGITIAFTSTYISDRVKQTRGTAEKMDARVVLDSVLAYTTNGIKQTWCFSNSWMQDPACDLNHPRNTERLLLSDETLTYISQTTTPHPKPVTDTRLTSIQQTVDLGNIMSSHPLSLILSPLRERYSSIAISIDREASAIQTTKGREVPLRIKIKLNPKDSSAKAQEINSKVYVYPREISYFSLVLPKDLTLGGSVVKPGENGLENVSVAGTGLRFESPVFVNDNLNLPTQGANMQNVTFVDKVYLGGGYIKQAGKLFYPRSAGGTGAAYNHDLPEFKGLLAGYELDTQRDLGLDYLFNLVTPPNLDEAAFNLCKARVAAAYDMEQTASAQLYTKLSSQGFNEFNLVTSVGRIDNLVEQKQSTTEAYRIYTNVPGVTDAGNIIRSGGSVFRAKIIYEGLQNPQNPAQTSNYRTEFYLSRNTDATIYPLGNTSATSPRIDIKTTPTKIGGNAQFHEVDFKVTFTNPNGLKMNGISVNNVIKTPTVQIVLEAFDYAYLNTDNKRLDPGTVDPKVGRYKMNGFVFYQDPLSANTMKLKYKAVNQWFADPTLSNDGQIQIVSNEHRPDNVDYVTFDQKCFQVPDDDDAYFMSFGASDWATSFVKMSRKAWSFSTEYDGSEPGKTGGYNSGTEILGDNVIPGYSRGSFHVMSLVNTCAIPANVNFVAGFYTCETLRIQARTTPLRIIGTFIVGKLIIDPSAYKAGIRWSNIYHPSAVIELRNAGVLGVLQDGSKVNCNSLPPLWMPNVGVKSVLSHFACNPVSLRRADPFKWSTVEPDCALDEDTGKVKCKKRVTRFLIKEVSRSGAL